MQMSAEHWCLSPLYQLHRGVAPAEAGLEAGITPPRSIPQPRC